MMPQPTFSTELSQLRGRPVLTSVRAYEWAGWTSEIGIMMLRFRDDEYNSTFRLSIQN